VKVHCDEGVATHIGPDPCVVAREDDCEASVGERAGQPLSRESVIDSGGRRRSLYGRQHRQARYCERSPGPAWSETLACTDAPCTGTGRSQDWPLALLGSDGPQREGEEP
jgi:hypothetical protein